MVARPPLRLAPADALALLLIVAAVVPLAVLAQKAAFHCDEFNVVYHATAFRLGDFARPGRPGLLWLLLVPLVGFRDPLVAMSVLRATAVAASAATLVLVWRLARGAPAGEGAPAWRVWAGPLAVLLLGFSGSFLDHAFEVRTDTYVLPLVLAALLWLTGPALRWRDAALAGVALGAAVLFSQKTAYNVGGLVVGYALWAAARPGPWRARLVPPLLRLCVAGGVAVALVGLWYGAMALINDPQATFVQSNIATAKATAFTHSYTLGRKAQWLWESMAEGPLVWWVGLAGLIAVLARLRWGDGRPAAAGAIGAVLVASITWHRGFHHYYIASIQPYLAVAGGVLAAWLAAGVTRLVQRDPAFAASLLAVVLLLGSLGTYVPSWRDGAAASWRYQRGVLSDAARYSGGPVPYWDGMGMMPGYPHVGVFMTRSTRLGARNRYEAQGGVFEEAFIATIEERAPVFFVRNYFTRAKYFYRPEQRALYEHYVAVRPNLYFLAVRMSVGVSHRDELRRRTEVLRSGRYRVHFRGGWRGQAWIGGQPVADGDVVALEAGPIDLVARPSEGRGELVAVWGEDTPVADPAEHVDYSMFARPTRDRYQTYDRNKRRKDADLTHQDLLTPASYKPAEYEERRARHLRWQADCRRVLGRAIEPDSDAPPLRPPPRGRDDG